ncbi:MAG: HPr family phosphocarrier protein [Peptostreptococcaceae bacterium]|nr:HPr family phosphocarrier protein [Peptostreptococcaceae bacterium]
MFKQNAKVVNEMGIHAKAASHIIKIATGYKSNIFIEYENKLINAKSIVSILAAAIPEGSIVTISAEGVDEQEAVKQLVHTIEEDY